MPPLLLSEAAALAALRAWWSLGMRTVFARYWPLMSLWADSSQKLTPPMTSDAPAVTIKSGTTYERSALLAFWATQWSAQHHQLLHVGLPASVQPLRQVQRYQLPREELLDSAQPLFRV